MIEHKSVLLKEVLQFLNPEPDRVYVDCTIGLGGHAIAILEKTQGKAMVIGIDWDQEALEIARQRLKPFENCVALYNENFLNLESILEKQKLSKVDGLILDLGLSSLQIEKSERGFSFIRDGPLDMRMSLKLKDRAEEVLARLGERELTWIFRSYGQESSARRIAHTIVQQRKRGIRVRRTRELVDLILALSKKRRRIHPATRVFQALRIAVNHELENLMNFMEKFDKYLGRGGRIVVISYHSLEDRAVKRSFLMKKEEGHIRILTKKPVVPSHEEIQMNPRSRSAKLRAAEKI